MSTFEQIVDRDTREPCSLCGAVADARTDGNPPLGWSADMIETSEGQQPRWVCGQCTRRFVRSIEAKLDHQWW